MGIVSRREIDKAMSLGTSQGQLGGNSLVLKILRKTPNFRPGQRLNEAAALMVEHGHSALAVTNQANRFLGIVTSDELLQIMLGNLRD